jgi:catechol 2,3-dioxygenase-like lactoylglutathione lyase family enzyme
MPLTTNIPIAFIPTTNAAAARTFYETVLGLNFVSADDFATIFRVGASQTMLRLVCAPQPFTPAPFTLFGWEVTDLHATIADLTTRGVEFLRIGYFEQDPDGVWTAPGGSQVAWFKDPDGNTLSLSNHPA